MISTTYNYHNISPKLVQPETIINNNIIPQQTQINQEIKNKEMIIEEPKEEKDTEKNIYDLIQTM